MKGLKTPALLGVKRPRPKVEIFWHMKINNGLDKMNNECRITTKSFILVPGLRANFKKNKKVQF